VGARIAAAVLGFGAAIVTARTLGPHGRAQLAVMVAVPALFSVVSVLGLDNANARFAGLSHSAFRQIFGRSVAFSTFAGTSMAAMWWLLGTVWPAALLGLGPRLALLSAALCPISLLQTLLGTAEIGRGRVGVYNFVTTATSAVYTVGVILLVASGKLSVAGAFIACGLGQLIGAISLLMLASQRVHADGEQIAMQRYCSYAARAYLPNLAQYGMLRIDLPIIQILAGTTAVAMYAVALPIGEVLLLFPTAVALAIFPRVTSGAVDRVAANRIGRTVFFAAAMLSAATALAVPIMIPKIYGVAYRGSIPVVWWMLPGLVMFSGGRTIQAYLAATDKLRLVIMATVAGVAACFAGLVFLSPRFGATGAAVADSSGYLAFTIVLFVGMNHRVRGRQLRTRLLQSGISHRIHPVTTIRREIGRSTRPIAIGILTVAVALFGAKLSVSGHLLTVFSVLILLGAIVRPRLGLYALAILIPVSQTSFGAPSLPDKDIAVLAVVYLVGQAAAGRLVRPKPVTAAIGLAVVTYLLLSATLTESATGTENWRYVILLGIPLLCLPLSVRDDAVTRRALAVMSITAACLAVVEVLTARAFLVTSGLASASAVTDAASAAAQTGAVNHNAEGALFVLALGILLALFPRTRWGITRLVYGAAIVALALGIAYSYSRAAYLGLLAMVAVFALRRSVRSIIGLAVTLTCLIPLLPTTVTARLGTIWNTSGLDADSAVRLDLWSSALRMFEAHPLFGVGYLNFAPQISDYYINTGNYDTFLIQFSKLDFAHNIYLTVLAETGLFGAVLVGTLILVGGRRAWSAARSGDWGGESALLVFVGVGVCSVFGEVLLVPPILAAFLLVVLAARRSKAEPDRV
jgi:O-antigen/teichoic acid export membrane protein/O-antigen ligase